MTQLGIYNTCAGLNTSILVWTALPDGSNTARAHVYRRTDISKISHKRYVRGHVQRARTGPATAPRTLSITTTDSATQTYMKVTTCDARASPKWQGGKWKWNRENPGNGTSRAFFLCNSHTTCAAGDGKQMRCVLLNGRFTIQHKGEHGEEASVKKRKNSVLSWSQAEDVSLMMTTGAKAGAMHTAMTDVVAKQHEAAGEDPLAYKLPGGGIQGVCV